MSSASFERDLAPLLTIQESAALLHVGRRTVERWVAGKRIKVVLLDGTRTKGSVRIPRAEVARILRSGGYVEQADNTQPERGKRD